MRKPCMDTTRLGMEECVDKCADSISPARGTNDHDEENCDPTAGRDLPLSKNASDSYHLRGCGVAAVVVAAVVSDFVFGFETKNKVLVTANGRHDPGTERR